MNITDDIIDTPLNWSTRSPLIELTPEQIDSIVQSQPVDAAEVVNTVTPPTTEVKPLDDAQLDAVVQDAELQKKFGNSPLTAAAAGAARGVSFGLSDQVLTKMGITDSQSLAVYSGTASALTFTLPFEIITASS